MSVCSKSYEETADLVCEKAPRSVYLNTLSSNLPECDRKNDMSTLEDGMHADMCYVYCAQRSCNAAKTFLEEHQTELREKCSMITYLHNGAIEMAQEELVDGPVCHQKIVESNIQKKGVQSTCLTCDAGDDGVFIKATRNGQAISANLVTTKGEVPDWYHRRGIIASLPTQFSCDERYHPPRPHQPSNASSKFQIDISPTDLPPNTTLAYWAAKDSQEVVDASAAYGDFENSGIVNCRDSICNLSLDTPGMYTTEGNVYRPHIHFTEWLGDRWNTTAKTIEFDSNS